MSCQLKSSVYVHSHPDKVHMISCRNAEAVGGRSKTTKPGMRYKRAPVDPTAVFFNLPVLHMPQASCEHFPKTKPKVHLRFYTARDQPYYLSVHAGWTEHFDVMTVGGAFQLECIIWAEPGRVQREITYAWESGQSKHSSYQPRPDISPFLRKGGREGGRKTHPSLMARECITKSEKAWHLQHAAAL